ncbi:PTS galactitol transporter subunit IIB, partial [Oenococcus oeni]
VCGTGIATSTIATGKIKSWLDKDGFANQVTMYQSKISDVINSIDDYDAVVSTTIVPENIKNKVINGVPLLTGIGVDQVYKEIKDKLAL